MFCTYVTQGHRRVKITHWQRKPFKKNVTICFCSEVCPYLSGQKRVIYLKYYRSTSKNISKFRKCFLGVGPLSVTKL